MSLHCVKKHTLNFRFYSYFDKIKMCIYSIWNSVFYVILAPRLNLTPHSFLGPWNMLLCHFKIIIWSWFNCEILTYYCCFHTFFHFSSKILIKFSVQTFLIVASPQKLILASGDTIRGNTVCANCLPNHDNKALAWCVLYRGMNIAQGHGIVAVSGINGMVCRFCDTPYKMKKSIITVNAQNRVHAWYLLSARTAMWSMPVDLTETENENDSANQNGFAKWRSSPSNASRRHYFSE